MTATATSPDIRPAIAAGNQRFMSAFSRGEAGEIAALYSSDARLLPPGGQPVSGAAGIEAFWRGAMDLGIKAARLESEELELHGARARAKLDAIHWKGRAAGRSTAASTW